jgi:hypothetical protein
MRLQPASELDPDIVQYVGHARDRRTHLRLELAPLSVLVVDGVLDRGDSQIMLADFDCEISAHLLNIRPEAQIARDRPSADGHQDDGGLKQVPEIDLRTACRRSSCPPDDSDPAGAEAQRLGLATDVQAALTCRLVSGDDFSWDIGVGVGTHDLPTALVFAAMP